MKKPFVLVHGAGGGGWNWDHVAPLLRRAGHEVRAPDLEMRDPETTIGYHAEQVVTAIADLHDVVLVGHSYGGMPITVVADHIPERLARVVYLDAFAPATGESAVAGRPELGRAFAPRVRGGLLPPIPPEVAGAAPEHHDLLRAGLVTTPWRCFVEPIVLAQEPTIPRTYVWCTQSGFGGVAARVRADGGWDYRELDTLHMCMYSAPEAVAELLLDCAA